MSIPTQTHDLQLLQPPGGTPGHDGLRLIGRQPSTGALCRIWLRRMLPWERAIDPRRASQSWDLRVFVKSDSAFALQSEFSVRDLDGLLETFAFQQGVAGLGEVSPNGDPLHDAVLSWAHKVTSTGPFAPRPAVDEAPVTRSPEPAAADDGWAEAEQIAARATGSVPAVEG